MCWFIYKCIANLFCTGQLGGRNKSIQIGCETPGHSSLNVDWYFNDTRLEISISNPKYEVNTDTGHDRLTVNDVVGADEGRYSCSYLVSEDQVNGTAGYLIVYGKYMYMYVRTCI